MKSFAMRLVFAALLSGLVAAAVAQETVELVSGDNIELVLPEVPQGSAQFDSRFFFQPPGATTRFRIALAPGTADNDLDLYLKAGSPFENITSLADIENQADFFAQGVGNEDAIVVERYQLPAPNAPVWFLGIVAFGGGGGNAGLSLDFAAAAPPTPADFQVDLFNRGQDPECNVGAWSDSTPFTAVGGNDARTLGAARVNAFSRAVAIVEDVLKSPIPVRVDACWRADDGTGSELRATLAVGAPGPGIPNAPGARAGNTIYAKSVIERQAGVDFCRLIPSEPCDASDVRIRFNEGVDGPEVLGDVGFYYGFDPAQRRDDQIDFVAIAVHELAHGLGFTTFLDEDGSLSSTRSDGETVDLLEEGFVDPFFARLVDNRQGDETPLVALADNAARAAAIVSETGLEWNGPQASVNARNDLAAFESGLVRMYAPAEYEPGSSVAHTDFVYCDLMLPANRPGCDEGFRTLNLTEAMLQEVGWADGPVVAPYVGLMFDRARPGHGFEIAFAGFEPDSGLPVYVLTFYSYETDTVAPEWFQAVGTVRDGVFAGDPAVSGTPQGLQEFVFAGGAQAAAGHRGQVVLDFNSTGQAGPCDDGVDRAGAELLVPMQWRIDDEVDEWCVEPLVPLATRPATDFAGLYASVDDDLGWGLSIENFGDTLFVLIYVYAEDGTPVWFFAQQAGFVPGQPLTMTAFQRLGSQRLQREQGFSDTAAGSITITLTDPAFGDLEAGNRVSLDVAYVDPVSDVRGTWQRDDVPLRLITAPRAQVPVGFVTPRP